MPVVEPPTSRARAVYSERSKFFKSAIIVRMSDSIGPPSGESLPVFSTRPLLREAMEIVGPSELGPKWQVPPVGLELTTHCLLIVAQRRKHPGPIIWHGTWSIRAK